MTVRYYSSVAQQTTLASTITGTTTVFSVASTTGFPSTTPFTLALDYGAPNEELVEVTDMAGVSLTATRAIDGTSATTHNSGAIVRHVSSARDFSDSRSHENASTNIHGLSVGSALVGTTDTQTLTNKTIAGGSITGTIAGSPSFTSGVVFNGGITLNNLSALAQPVNATDPAYRSKINGDTNSRLIVQADGKLVLGSGSVTGDTNLYRSGVATLKTDNKFSTGQGLDINTTAADQISFKGSTNNVGNIIFRVSTSTNAVAATVSDRGEIVTNKVTELVGTPWTQWTPLWTTSTGLHLPSFGNATVAAWYQLNGGSLLFSVAITFGSTTNFGAGATTSDNWQFSLPSGITAASQFRGTEMIAGFGRGSQNAGSTAPFSIKIDSSGGYFMLDLAGGLAGAFAPSNFGAADSLTPWTWASGNVLAFSGSVATL